MTLTSILPTLRDSIAAPFDSIAWPAGSVPLIDDVTLSAVSLRRYADICGTPCVCTGAAVIPFSGGVASTTESTTVVVATVVSVERSQVQLDACLGGVEPVWREARLLGRVSHAHDERFAIVRTTAGCDEQSITLPGDLRVGDLVALPLPGLTLGRRSSRELVAPMMRPQAAARPRAARCARIESDFLATYGERPEPAEDDRQTCG